MPTATIKFQITNLWRNTSQKNLNPATDIYFSTGPMDVLDHSCSKTGFGGKMCVDGTKKWDEEISTEFNDDVLNNKLTEESLKAAFAEIKHVNLSLLKDAISCILISVEKNRVGHIKSLHQQLYTDGWLSGVKLVLYVEHTVDANDLPTALWRFCNNLDPKRDSVLAENAADPGQMASMGFDGTRKTPELDNFHRDWPNIIVADDNTIASVDQKWERLGLGAFVPSPSLKFKSQMYGEEAVVQEM
ncbi:MAG: UbiD family decarboxylase [Chitinophagaceae bacterium]|nr:UbiD family decarboxylase [Chitinophagaceae bacterium]